MCHIWISPANQAQTKNAKRYCSSWSRSLLHVFTADRYKESPWLLNIPHAFRLVSCLFQAWYTRGPARDVDLREGTSGAEDAGFGNDKPFADFIVISQMSFLWLVKIWRRLSNMIVRYKTDEIRVPAPDFIHLPLLQRSKPPSNCIIVICLQVQ